MSRKILGFGGNFGGGGDRFTFSSIAAAVSSSSGAEAAGGPGGVDAETTGIVDVVDWQVLNEINLKGEHVLLNINWIIELLTSVDALALVGTFRFGRTAILCRAAE